MKVLITGGAGFIGSQLAYRLWKNGDDVVLVDNFSYGKEDNLVFPDKDFRGCVVKADVRDRVLIHSMIESGNFDCIFHIAGIAPLPDCQSNPQEAIDVNVIGTVNVLEGARKSGVRKIIFASTNAVYENNANFPSTEDAIVSPSLIYPNTKFCAERFCESYCATYGMNVTALRFANVYGPHIDCLRKQPPFVGYMIRELYYDRVPVFYSNGSQGRDYVFVDDLIDLALTVMGKKNEDGFEVVNVSSKQSYTVKEMYQIVSRMMGKNIDPVFENSAKYWDKFPEMHLGSFPIKREVLLNEVNKKTLCDNSLAKNKYGWSPKTGINEGLEKTVEYVRGVFSNMK